MKHPEHAMQVAFFVLVALDRRTKHLPIFAVPNGAYGSPRQGAWMRAEGLRSGVPDVFVCVRGQQVMADDPPAGLALELKSATGRVSPAQQQWAALLTAHGWRVQVVRSTQEAWDALLNYLGEQP